MVTQMADDPAIMEAMIAQNPQLQQAMQVSDYHTTGGASGFFFFFFPMSGLK